MYEEKCYWYDVKNVFSKNSRSKNEFRFDDLNYWWSECFDDSILIDLIYCYCYCSWDDQRYVEKCFVFNLMFRSFDVFFTWWSEFDWLIMTSRIRRFDLIFLRFCCCLSLKKIDRIRKIDSSENWFVVLREYKKW